MSPVKDPESIRKAAILMVLLGEDTSAEVMKYFSQEEAQELTKAIYLLGNIAPREAETVLEEFHQMSIAQQFVAQGGVEYARKVLMKTYGTDLARKLLDQVTRSLGPINFDILAKADPQQLAKFIESEHPQTIALILAHLPSHKAAQIITQFQPNLRADVAIRMANIEQISQDIISKITVILRQKLEAVGDFSRESYGGVRAVAELFNRMDWLSGKGILEKIEEKDPNLAINIRNLMFVFDDIMGLDDMAIKELLKEVDKKDLATALKGCSEQLRQRFFRNMSERAVGLLKEDMEYMGAIKVKDVETAQQNIIEIIRRLDEQGIIDIKGGGEQYVV